MRFIHREESERVCAAVRSIQHETGLGIDPVMVSGLTGTRQ